MQTSMSELRQRLDDARIFSRTIALTESDKYLLYVADFQEELQASIAAIGKHYDVRIEQTAGEAIPIGVEDLNDARTRIGHFMDDYNLLRPDRGIGGLVPADGFFGAASEVLQTLKERVAANALELAQHGSRPSPFYVTGQVDGRSFSLHGEGRRLILTRPGQQRVRTYDPRSSIGSRTAVDRAKGVPA